MKKQIPARLPQDLRRHILSLRPSLSNNMMSYLPTNVRVQPIEAVEVQDMGTMKRIRFDVRPGFALECVIDERDKELKIYPCRRPEEEWGWGSEDADLVYYDEENTVYDQGVLKNREHLQALAFMAFMIERFFLKSLKTARVVFEDEREMSFNEHLHDMFSSPSATIGEPNAGRRAVSIQPQLYPGYRQRMKQVQNSKAGLLGYTQATKKYITGIRPPQSGGGLKTGPRGGRYRVVRGVKQYVRA